MTGRLGSRPNGDAQGVLQAVIAHRAKNALLNKIVAEIEIVLGATSGDAFVSGRGET